MTRFIQGEQGHPGIHPRGAGTPWLYSRTNPKPGIFIQRNWGAGKHRPVLSRLQNQVENPDPLSLSLSPYLSLAVSLSISLFHCTAFQKRNARNEQARDGEQESTGPSCRVCRIKWRILSISLSLHISFFLCLCLCLSLSPARCLFRRTKWRIPLGDSEINTFKGSRDSPAFIQGRRGLPDDIPRHTP